MNQPSQQPSRSTGGRQNRRENEQQQQQQDTSTNLLRFNNDEPPRFLLASAAEQARRRHHVTRQDHSSVAVLSLQRPSRRASGLGVKSQGFYSGTGASANDMKTVALPSQLPSARGCGYSLLSFPSHAQQQQQQQAPYTLRRGVSGSPLPISRLPQQDIHFYDHEDGASSAQSHKAAAACASSPYDAHTTGQGLLHLLRMQRQKSLRTCMVEGGKTDLPAACTQGLNTGAAVTSASDDMNDNYSSSTTTNKNNNNNGSNSKHAATLSKTSSVGSPIAPVYPFMKPRACLETSFPAGASLTQGGGSSSPLIVSTPRMHDDGAGDGEGGVEVAVDHHGIVEKDSDAAAGSSNAKQSTVADGGAFPCPHFIADPLNVPRSSEPGYCDSPMHPPDESTGIEADVSSLLKPHHPIDRLHDPAAEEGEEEDGSNAIAEHAPDAVGLVPVLASSMPRGRYVMLNLLTTWGDMHEIGLCGIELFNEAGDRILPLDSGASFGAHLKSTSRSRRQESPQHNNNNNNNNDSDNEVDDEEHEDDKDVPQRLSIEDDMVTLTCGSRRGGGLCILAEYTATPEEIYATGDTESLAALQADERRQLRSVINGVHRTHDEGKMLALPYTPGRHHLLCFVFPRIVTISMIRLHNYCGRGRVHTTKGTRIAEVTVDDVCVFRGEVAQHSGELTEESGQEGNGATATVMSSGLVDCENILFTDDAKVLSRIMRYSRLASSGTIAEDDAASSSSAGSAYVRAQSDRDVTSRRQGQEEEARAEKERVGTRSGFTLVVRPRERDETYMGEAPTIAVTARQSRHFADAHAAPGEMSGRLGEGHSLAPVTSSGRRTAMPVRPASAIPVGSEGSFAIGAPSSRGPPRRESLPSASCTGTSSTSRDCGGWFTTEASSASTANKNEEEKKIISGSSNWMAASPTQVAPSGSSSESPLLRASQQQQQQQSRRRQKTVMYPNNCPTNITSICFLLLSTWGDSARIGLSGLRFRDDKADIISEAVAQWHVQYPDGSRANAGVTDAELPFLFDEDPRTACLLPFQPCMQMVLVFNKPVPTLGFLEVANYSVGDTTFCGVKEVRLFLSSAPVTAPHADVYRHLWTVGGVMQSRALLRTHAVREVTPTEGVTLRKAPAHLSQPRFQTYDLSLATDDSFSFFPDEEAGGNNNSSKFVIGVGPGTGGTRTDSLAGGTSFGGGGGGSFGNALQHPNIGFANTMSSFANSLNTSMNIRAAMAMKRARMMLKERPEWLLDYQPYITPLLPVGYVCRVRLHVCARSIVSSSSGSFMRADPSSSPCDHAVSGTSTTTTYGTAQGYLKAYMKEWVVRPTRACSFVNDCGQVIYPIRPGKTPPQPASATTAAAGNGDDEEEVYVPMVTECLVHAATTAASTESGTLMKDASGASSRSGSAGSSTGASSAGATAAPLQVTVDLLYVADTPFCLSILSLNRPLVLDGSAAWTKRVQVFMDDTAIYDSGDAVLSLAREHSAPVSPSPMSLPLHTGDTEALSTTNGSSMSSHTLCPTLPRCKTSLKPYILFTLDSKVLDAVRSEMEV